MNDNHIEVMIKWIFVGGGKNRSFMVEKRQFWQDFEFIVDYGIKQSIFLKNATVINHWTFLFGSNEDYSTYVVRRYSIFRLPRMQLLWGGENRAKQSPDLLPLPNSHVPSRSSSSSSSALTPTSFQHKSRFIHVDHLIGCKRGEEAACE